MENRKIHTLIPLETFKAVLSIDDRDDAMSRYCLVTATYTIEQYCRRRLLRKKHFEFIECCPASLDLGDLILPLREYPVSEVLAVYVMGNSVKNLPPCRFLTSEFALQTPAKAIDSAASMPPKAMGNGEILEPEFYHTVPECGVDEDIPFSLFLSPALQRYWRLGTIKVVYWAGYMQGKIPPDLASACLELAAWNMNRYKGRRIGMTGNVRGTGKEGEHFEISIPENMRMLIEPYKRRVI